MFMFFLLLTWASFFNKQWIASGLRCLAGEVMSPGCLSLICFCCCLHQCILQPWSWVNVGSGNGLVPDGTKPLPKPWLTYPSDLCQLVSSQFMPHLLTWFSFNLNMDRKITSIIKGVIKLPLPEPMWTLIDIHATMTVLLSHTSLGMWLLIHAGIKVKPC